MVAPYRARDTPYRTGRVSRWETATIRKVATSMIVDSALITGKSLLFLIIAYTSVGSVSAPGPLTKYVTT